MTRVAILLALIGCGGSSGTPANTDVLVVSLADFESPKADVRARLAAGAPSMEEAKLTCKDAAFEIAFERRLDPQTSNQYLDKVRVRVLDAKGARITARRLNPENRAGEGEPVEMALVIIVSVDHGGSGGDCSYLVRATKTPAIAPS